MRLEEGLELRIYGMMERKDETLIPLLLLWELEDDSLSGQLVVDGREGVELVVQVAGVFLIKETKTEGQHILYYGTISTTL